MEQRNESYYVQEFKLLGQFLIDQDKATPELLLGCTESEILQIEKKIKRPLPPSYRAYLLVMGICAGDLWDVDQANFLDLAQINDMFHQNLKENNLEDSSLFGVYMHDGFVFGFFNLNDTEPDPQMRMYMENLGFKTTESHDSPFKDLGYSFFQFVQNNAKGFPARPEDRGLTNKERMATVEFMTKNIDKERIWGLDWAKENKESKIFYYMNKPPIERKFITVEYAPIDFDTDS